MPIFYQQTIDKYTKLGVWKIEETEAYFLHTVPLQKVVTHPHKRLQHLAGRFLLRYLFPDFPIELIRIADTRKPFLESEAYHFSISHCGDYAAAIVSKYKRVGVDIEMFTNKIGRIKHKFLHQEEPVYTNAPIVVQPSHFLTLLWSTKEAVFKWYGDGKVDFIRHIQLEKMNNEQGVIDCTFKKNINKALQIHYILFDYLVLTWITD